MELNKNIAFSEFSIPQSFDAECGVLAELIGNEQYFTLSAGVLNEDCFYASEAKEAYKALCVMVEAGEHIDLMTASQRINKAFYMANIITKESYASEATFLSHCEVLSTLNQKRKLYFACCRGIQMSNSMGATKEEMMQFPTALANEITDGVYVNSTKQIGTVINELGEAIEKDDTKRVPTGFPSLDRMVYGGFSAGNLVVLAARPSVGKAQPITSKVLTPKGFVCLGDIEVGDKVIGRNGKEQYVLGKFPQGIRPTYKVTFSDKTSVLCDKEHIWTIINDRRKEVDLTLSEMMRRGIKAKASEARLASGRKDTPKYRVPIVSPIEFTEKQFEVNPYILGVLIGDGSLVNNTAFFSNPDMDGFIHDKVAGLLPEGYVLTKHKGTRCPQYGIKLQNYQKNKGKGYIQRLRAMGLNVKSGEKFIPEEYFLGSAEQRFELLRGLMDTDGSVQNGQALYHTTSAKLAEDVVRLVQTLGGLAKVYFCSRKDKTDEYRVSLRMRENPFSLPRKAEKWKTQKVYRWIENVEYVGEQECVCIYVSNDDHLYITDNYTVTHNTSVMLQMAREAAGKGIPSLVLSLEMTNNELAQRLLFSTHLINAYEVANKKVDWANFEKAGAVFSGSKLYMDETPQTLDEVCSTITIAHQRGQCEIAYIDYLQLMSTPESRNSLYQQVTETTKKIKKLAKKLNIPIVLLCQLNRNSVSEHRQPQLHDLRDSGSIEQDADIVLMLERLKDAEGSLTNRVNMYVRKNRGGLAGDITIELESDNNYTTFVEVTNYD